MGLFDLFRCRQVNASDFRGRRATELKAEALDGSESLNRSYGVAVLVILAAAVLSCGGTKVEPWTVVATQQEIDAPVISYSIDYVAPTGGVVRWQRVRGGGNVGESYEACWREARVGESLPQCAREESSPTPSPTRVTIPTPSPSPTWAPDARRAVVSCGLTSGGVASGTVSNTSSAELSPANLQIAVRYFDDSGVLISTGSGRLGFVSLRPGQVGTWDVLALLGGVRRAVRCEAEALFQ